MQNRPQVEYKPNHLRKPSKNAKVGNDIACGHYMKALEKFPRTVEQLATKFNLPLARVQRTMEVLRGLKFVRQREDGAWERVE